MKVLLIGPYPPPFGGISNYLFQTEDLLNREGNKIEIINTGLNKNIHKENIYTVKRWYENFIKVITADMDICHINVAGRGHITTFLSTVLAMKFKKAKLILTVHNSNFFRFLKHLKGIKGILAGIGLKEIDKVICVNNVILTQAHSMGISKEKSVIIPAFLLDESEIKYDLPENLLTFSKNHMPLIITCGFYWPHRNDLYGFLDSIKLLKSLKDDYPSAGLVIAGDGNEKQKKEYIELIESLGLKDDVSLAGDLSHNIFISLLKMSDLFIRPTKDDGDAISVREAIAMGKPVVASETEFRPEGVGVFPIGDTSLFEHEVRKALKNNKKSDSSNKHKSYIQELIQVYSEMEA